MVRWTGAAAVGLLSLQESLPFWQAAVLVAIPPLLSLYTEIRVAQISAAATALASIMEETDEDDVS